MNALLNEYRHWRDQKIEEAFENCVANAEDLRLYVEEDMRAFELEYESSVTLRKYKEIQYELLREEICPTLIINEPVFWWCAQSIMDDDWDKLFNDHEPETEQEEKESEEEQA